MMKKAHLIQYFSFMLSNEDIVKAKPHPEIYLTAIAKLGLRPEECLILEDNQHGIEAALASGANLMKIGEPTDVTYANIINRINQAEQL